MALVISFSFMAEKRLARLTALEVNAIFTIV
eukprot:CAMPEP_0172423458 /NCGR_PEP_ID=MMETSP1064-20121228/16718_1 /TAXON_ID=202472 /ORGANISM="Aulacoseira subarctica , Strain CCAP 1002/5" /LENGTH=30 /DNA_ID= /DNA_START= /DNA_END= /DNA_ORIENTATION=